MKEKGFNLQIVELKENLAKVLNEAKMPTMVKQMALFEISSQVNQLVAQEIEAERKAWEEGEKDGNKSSKSND
ncbi:hypothetical protein Ana3638_11945 [Anaerocolumna sedimenticola]|uniref:Uncharacterized protein n=1 Tax=Anaerocolumna sedimenticola TaxID=2696063 RepID=A0A6P1TM71_9FIRM|nr:hypothetical protein [Anaerocolumna sedimenticola]QHQ61397.1 hypothetical protein Ana3638_11945 [Anaerocolumna sedimenticola]